MPDTLVICNTSPLLYLNLVGQLDLLPALYQTVTIPPTVRDELAVGKKQGVQVPDVYSLEWLQVVPLRDRTLIPLVTDLGSGEAEVIGLGLEHPRSRLILDDGLGRRIARLHRLIVTGTAGVVIKAKRLGLVSSVRAVVHDLQAAGLWLGDELVREILRQAGES